MLKTLFTWFVLFNYLLVVGATNVQSTIALKYTQPSAAEKLPYQHANNCQVTYYLQFDCFEQCNGAVQASHHSDEVPIHVSLLQANGLDFHSMTLLSEVNKNSASAGNPAFAPQHQEIIPGFISINCPPPNLV